VWLGIQPQALSVACSEMACGMDQFSIAPGGLVGIAHNGLKSRGRQGLQRALVDAITLPDTCWMNNWVELI
jgi:hypothetical protein